MPLSFRYQVSALDYIDKALSAEEFESRIETALLYANGQDSKSLAEDCFYFKSKFAQFQYPFKEVYYLETSPRPHHVILYSETDRLEFTASWMEDSQAGTSSLAVPSLFSHQSCQCGAFG